MGVKYKSEVELHCERCGHQEVISSYKCNSNRISTLGPNRYQDGFERKEVEEVGSICSKILLCKSCLEAEEYLEKYRKRKEEDEERSRLQKEAKEILGKNYYEADDIMEIFRKNKDKQHKKAFNRIINSLKDRAERRHLLEHLVSDRDSRERSDEFMAIIEYKEHFRAMGYKVKVPDDGFSSDSRIAKVEVEDPFKDH